MKRKPKEIRVKVIASSAKPNFILRWIDPISGKARQRATAIRAVAKNRRKAERAAADLEREIDEWAAAPSEFTWETFRRAYEEEHLSALDSDTLDGWTRAADHLHRLLCPEYLADINTPLLTRFAVRLRDRKLSSSSIKSYVSRIMAALRWAARQGMIADAPRSPQLPKSGRRKARARPITGEEYDRIIAACDLVRVRKQDGAVWRRLIEGLYLGGLRISEACVLSWDASADFSVVLDGDESHFRILEQGQKSGRYELCPMAPEFVEFLARTPEEDRRGLVFVLPTNARQAGRVVGRAGAKARVKVNAEDKTATAHDLRRAFGTRWAVRVQPAVLQRLMRHVDIHTTMSYYVGLDVATVAKELWRHVEKMGDHSGDKSPEEPEMQIAKDRGTS